MSAQDTALIVVDVQESFRQAPYWDASELPTYLSRQQALIDAIERGLAVDALNRQVFIQKNEIRRKWLTLSSRERDVCALMLEGHTNKGISERLDILPDTAKKHRANVLQKMAVHQLADLLALCKSIDLNALGDD